MSDSSPSYSQSQHVIAKLVDGETVLLDLESSTYFGLNKVGGRIWELLGEAPRGRTELVGIVVAEFDVDEATASADIDALVGDLAASGLIVAGAR